MSQRSSMLAVLAAAGLLASSAVSVARAQEALTIEVATLEANGCIGKFACSLDGASVATNGGSIARKTRGTVAGFGVNGGPAGPEIDLGQKLRIDFEQSRTIVAIQILFLYNGPEFGDRAERAQVKADGVVYTLAVGNNADDADADWSGPGSVTKCGATTAAGTGCFVVADPFPDAVDSLEFKAAPGGQPFPAHGGPGTSESDYSIGFVDVAATGIIDLAECADAAGCPVATVGGNVAFSLSSMEVANPGGSTEAAVIPVRLPDCRYIPRACLGLLPPAGDSAASDDAARALLIGFGVIKPLDPSGPAKLHPAAQLLNVTPLLPPEVTSLFDASGVPPNGLPPLYIGPRWRAQSINQFWFDAFFFRTDGGVQFSETFDGLIDVSLLAGQELGCFPVSGNLLAWDVATSASELARSVGGRHVDKIINVGCQNPTKVEGERLSLYSINLAPTFDTFGPTIKSHKPKVTVNNDAVFARLVQSLWKDIGEVRSRYACQQADPAPTGGVAPLAKAACDLLAGRWALADIKVGLCVHSSFFPASSYRTWICDRALDKVADFESALPATATGPDPFNRLGELKTRVNVFQHVWDERFLLSLEPGGFCREKGSCPP